jgi:hypothetical protein
MHPHRPAGPSGRALMTALSVVLQAAAGIHGTDAGSGALACVLSVTLWDELARPAPAPRPIDPASTTAGFGIAHVRR